MIAVTKRWIGTIAISLLTACTAQAAARILPSAIRLLHDGAGSIDVIMPDHETIVLDLKKIRVLAADAQVTVTTAKGVEPIAVGGDVFVGRVEGDASSSVAIVVRPGGVSGTVELKGQAYELHSTGDQMTLRLSDTQGPASSICAMGPSPETGDQPGRDRAAPSWTRRALPFTLDWTTPLVCDVAIECDYALYLRHDSNASALVDHVLAAMGTVGSLYGDSVNVTVEIVRLNIHAMAENPDPFGTSNSASDVVLANFHAWEQANLGSVRRRISLLLVGTDHAFGDRYSGLADQDGIGSQAAPSAVVATTANTSTGMAPSLIGHEFGHLFHARHTFSCWYGDHGYLPSGTVISWNNTGLGQRIEGGCCDLVCDPLCEPCPPPAKVPACWRIVCSDNLGLQGQMMGYPAGFDMHAAVKQVIRENAVGYLLQDAPLYASSTCTTIELDWNSPPGTPVEYDLRRSSQPISSSNFDWATRLGTGTPRPSGEAESKVVAVGGCSGLRYFALRWRDSRDFWSNATLVRAGTPCGFCYDVGFAPVPEKAALAVVTEQPAKDEVTLRFDVPRGAQHVVLTLYDVAGRIIERPVQGLAHAGRQSWTWHPVLAGPSQSRSGVYFAHLRVDDVEISRSILLVQ